MPFLDLTVNVPIADIKALTLELSKAASQILAKPETAIGVRIRVDEALAFGGTFEPAFWLSIVNLGITRETNEAHIKALSEFLTQKLGLPNDRGLIAFIDPGRENLGFKGTTIATLLG
ncbi:Tautomerase/MIF superfamily [Schizophyllum commune]